MSLEYRFYGAADVTTAQLTAFLAAALDATAFGTDLERDGLTVTAYRVEPGEEASAAERFGFTHRVTASFRFSNLASEQLRDENTVLMARALVGFLDEHPGAGVLLFNGEEVVLQKLGDVVAFSSDWEDGATISGMAAVVAGRTVRELPQPLL